MSETKGRDADKASAAQKPQATPRRRRGLTSSGDGGRISRPLLAALLVVIAGGAYLFWPRGGGAPVGIGEQLSVVTADGDSVGGTRPRSGSVDIDDELQPLVPESPAGGGSAAEAAAGAAPPGTTTKAPAEAPAKPREAAPPKAQEAAPKTATPPASRQRDEAGRPAEPAARPELINPRPTGPWALQIGAFQKEGNADGVVNELAAKGIKAHVRAAGTSSGAIVYRVWVGWFPDREQAQAYARQERQRLGEAFPVHR